MFWHKTATERYKAGSFDLEFIETNFGTMPNSTQAPDGSIIVIFHQFSNYNSDPGSPPLQTGYTNIDLKTPAGYAWDGQTWYTRVRVQWAVANSSTRAVSPATSSTFPYKSYKAYVIRSNGEEALTLTSSAVGSINFNPTKAPSTLLCLDVGINKVTLGNTDSSKPTPATYSFGGVSSKHETWGSYVTNGTDRIWVMLAQASVFGGTQLYPPYPIIDSATDYYATGSDTLSRTANDMDYSYIYIVEAS